MKKHLLYNYRKRANNIDDFDTAVTRTVHNLYLDEKSVVTIGKLSTKLAAPINDGCTDRSLICLLKKIEMDKTGQTDGRTSVCVCADKSHIHSCKSFSGKIAN
jgi:hypothetical protein